MRWANLFDDLEGQLQSALTAEDLGLEVEEERLRLAGLGMRDRLVALHTAGASTAVLQLSLTNGQRLVVRPTTFGMDWFAASFVERTGQCVVPLRSIAGVSLSRAQVRVSLASSKKAREHPSLDERLGLSFVLRDLCRRRRAIEVVLADGAIHGTIDRVGGDHLDLAMHEPGSARRETAVTDFRLVPLDAIVFVAL